VTHCAEARTATYIASTRTTVWGVGPRNNNAVFSNVFITHHSVPDVLAVGHLDGLVVDVVPKQDGPAKGTDCGQRCAAHTTIPQTRLVQRITSLVVVAAASAVHQ
jgi:hypothetical protein